jgi:hypothetical protein
MNTKRTAGTMIQYFLKIDISFSSLPCYGLHGIKHAGNTFMLHSSFPSLLFSSSMVAVMREVGECEQSNQKAIVH